MEHQPQDDIPMVDAPEPVPSQLSSSAQRFSIVDVLGGESGPVPPVKEPPPSVSGPDPIHSDLYECDEGRVLHRLQELYPHTDIQKLPRFWNKNDRWMPSSAANSNGTAPLPILELSSDFLRVTKRKGTTLNSKDAAAVRANRPIPRSCIVYYFEITVVSKGQDGYMGVGLSEKAVSLNRLPGWDQTSYGYHGDDGNFFSSSGKGVEYGPTFTTGDVIGCGLNFVTREIFFTKNGQHLGVANAHPIPLHNELFPTVGMQTADEMIDANFGQRPFLFDIRSEFAAAEAFTLNNVAGIGLPPDKVLWMNSFISNWMAHEGYSRALDALNRAIGCGPAKQECPTVAVANSDSQGSTLTSTSKDSQSPTVAAEKVAETVMRSMLGLLGAENGIGTGTGGARRSVVRSVQEALHEEMEQRRALVRMVKRGQLAEAMDRVEQLYPTLLDSNKQLALLLKVQHFVEMLSALTKELPPLPIAVEEQQPSTSTCGNRSQFVHSPSPRPSSSRSGKRSASAVDDDGAMAGTSSGADGFSHQHNPVKRRSSDEELSGQPKQQNGNSIGLGQQLEESMEMEMSGEEADPGPRQTTRPMGQLDPMANGRTTNGCPSVLVGTPPTSTTIIDEPAGEMIDLVTDGLPMETGEERGEPEECGGFSSAEEQSQFEQYASILEFGQQISRFANKMEADESQDGCLALRQRMNAAFSLICYRDLTQSDHAYLLDQSQRDLVAKALNAAILELHAKEGISPLDKCLRRARFIRDQALTCSASAVFTDANRLLFGENPTASPGHSGIESQSSVGERKTYSGTTEANSGARPKAKSLHLMDSQKKEV